MENKINIEEYLRLCPKGMELDCTIYNGKVCFEGIDDNNPAYPIIISINKVNIEHLDIWGQYSTREYGKCIIFPKGKTTWEGFVPPCKFKDGDIITDSLGTCIFKGEGRIKGTVDYYCGIHVDYFCVKDNKHNPDGHYGYIVDYRLATEEEKQKLFAAIKENGYKWNAETKTLDKLPKFKVGDTIKDEDGYEVEITKVDIDKECYEYQILEYPSMKSIGIGIILFDDQNNWELVLNKLVQPKFKVGDRVRTIYGDFQYDIKELTDTHYTLVEVEYKYEYTEPIIEDKNWELVPNKFDITTLVPFESRVLVRDDKSYKWSPAVWGFYDEVNKNNYPYEVVGGQSFQYCIPYNDDTKHLIGKTNDCVEYYKTWE